MMETRNAMLPNLIIIGAKKAGTTSLHLYLDLHPEIAMSRHKELNFFVESRNWGKGREWYERQFRGRARIHGESCPQYSSHPHYDGVPERMHGMIPDAKLIYLVRHPVERILADYVHKVAAGNEDRTLSEALADPETNAYVNRSRYHLQLSRYLDHFPLSQILLVSQEELLAERGATLRRVFGFLGVDESFESPRFARLYHQSKQKRRSGAVGRSISQLLAATRLAELLPGPADRLDYLLTYPFSRPVEKPALDDTLRDELLGVLADDLAKLRATTGRSFDEWGLP